MGAATFERLEACGAWDGVLPWTSLATERLPDTHSIRPKEPTPLGPQERRLGDARIFLAPNPSPGNAHFRAEDQVRFYDELSDLLTIETEPHPVRGGAVPPATTTTRTRIRWTIRTLTWCGSA